MINIANYKTILVELIDYLATFHDSRWVPTLQRWVVELDECTSVSELRAHATRSVAASHGMGSLGDFSICPQNGHMIANDRHQMSQASRGLWQLTARLYEESQQVLRDTA